MRWWSMPAPSRPTCMSLSRKYPRKTGVWPASWATKGKISMSTNGDARATALAHMLLKVADINRSERFYVDLLGFKVRPAKPLADGRPFVPFEQGIALTTGGANRAPQIG